jgi:hypothetical protein
MEMPRWAGERLGLEAWPGKWVTKKQGHTDQSYKKFLPHHTKTTNTTTP